MKKLFSLVLCVIATMTASAQEIDTSNWKEGDDVSEFLNWGDYDGSWSGEKEENGNGDYTPKTMGDWWKGSMPNELGLCNGQGAYGFYSSGAAGTTLPDMYQVVYFPAGHYVIEVQAVYREGTNGDTFINYFNHNIKKNAWLYANLLTSDDPESEVTRSFTKLVGSLPTADQHEQLYYDSDGSWKNDWSYTYTDNDGVQTVYYCPSGENGACTYFLNGKYQISMDIVLEEAGYVRFGIKKTANISQDWLVFSNFHIIYEGEADESAKLVLALNDYDASMENLETIHDQILDKGYGALASIIEDQYMNIDDTADKSTREGVVAATEKLDALYSDGSKALLVAYNLADLISNSEDMIASTNFPGKADFESVFGTVKTKASAEDPAEINNDINIYSELYSELSKARADYLNTGEKDENGAKDFTSLIKYPWFVNPEYTPVQLDNGTWCIQQDGSTDLWKHGTVAQGCTDVANVYTNGRAQVSSKVILNSDPTVTNEWYKFINYSAGWSAGLKLMYQGSLVGVSDGWNSGLTGTMEIRQQLEGLPNGYYSLKGLVRGNASGSWSESNLPPYHNIFAQNSDEVVVRSQVGHTDSYYSPTYGWYEWNNNVWQEHKTGIIQVSDGKLLIGGQTSMVGNFTGFRLMFYGETPAFDDMIQEEIDIVKSQVEENNIVFAGDVAYIDSLLAEIKLPLASADAYEAAFANTTAAKEYIQKASSTTKSYSLPSDYATLAAGYEDGSAQASILAPAIEAINALGMSTDDTYEDVAPAKTIYNAYKSYIAFYDKTSAIDNADLQAALAAQVAELAKGYSDAETLNNYMTDLNLLVSTANIIALGGKDATESNPVDITSLITNPDFTSSPTSGWSGNTATSNEYARGNAEIWNASSIDFYQTIKALPQGTYELRVRALYRDAKNITDSINAAWTGYWTDANGDVEQWAHHYATLYASTETADTSSYIQSVCQGKFTTPSFNRWVKQVIEGDVKTDEKGEVMYDEQGNEIVETDTIWCYFNDSTRIYDETLGDSTWSVKLHGYPFDETVVTDEGTYYYPSSMYGAYCRFNLNPDMYCSSLKIEVKAGEDLRIGLKKSGSFSGDWVIFDDFQLFYLGGDLSTDTGIANVEQSSSKSKAIYNLNGQQVKNMSKGIYIINGKKYFVK